MDEGKYMKMIYKIAVVLLTLFLIGLLTITLAMLWEINFPFLLVQVWATIGILGVIFIGLWLFSDIK